MMTLNSAVARVRTRPMLGFKHFRCARILLRGMLANERQFCKAIVAESDTLTCARSWVSFSATTPHPMYAGIRLMCLLENDEVPLRLSRCDRTA
jgi:hypothetical protein